MALNKIEVPTGTQVPRRISAPAAERAFAIAHPKPRSSATPAMKALLPRKSIGRPGLEPVPLTEAKTFPAFLGSFAPLLLTVLTLVFTATKLGSKEVCRREFEVAGTNAVKHTFEGDEVTPAAICVADTVVRVIAACMLDNEAAILPTHLFLDTTTRPSAPFVLSPTKREKKSEKTRSNHTSIPTSLPTTCYWPIHFT
jgi:hypothetical protein